MARHDAKAETKSSQRGASKGWVVFLTILLTICLVLLIYGLSFDQTFFRDDFLIEQIEKQGFYTEVPGMISEVMISEFSKSEMASQHALLSEDQLTDFVSSILPADWIRQQTERVIRSVISYIEFEQETLSILIDTQPVKQNLLGPAGKDAFLSLLSGLPDCTTEQMLMIGLAIETGQTSFDLCNPPETLLPLLDFVLDPILAEIATSIPASVQIPPPGQSLQLQPDALSQVFRALRGFQAGFNLLPWAAGFLILLIVVFSWQSMRLMMSGFSFSFLFAGVAGILPGGIIFWGGRFPALLVNSYTRTIPEYLRDPLSRLLEAIFKVQGQLLLILGLGFLLVGFVFLVLKFIAKK